ncbi:response regulator [Flavobacterium cellulosilyticum]|uniref:histidine kinase n=1 Tax=Flavobacterium cellulosilyticum TaxID=2541731 RepID=A0A4R5CHC7_9FLAO|nr:response regulator [Flavobacterium cellulosilyticum]TDD98446.1 response regulator [Flavobacterium cellulosilyticum]
MKISLGRKIVLGFIVSILVIFGVAIFSFKNSEKFVASNALINHTNQVLHEFEKILIYTLSAETGVRGYVITGDNYYLNYFSTSDTFVKQHLNKVKELTKDNLNQQNNIEELQNEIKIRFDNLNTAIALRKNNFEKAKEFIATRKGKIIQEKIGLIIDRAEEIEYQLLSERKIASEDDAATFNSVFAVLLLIIILILVVVYYVVTENLKALEIAESETASKNWLLTGNFELNEKLIGDQSITQLANGTISFLCNYLKANIGAVYLFNDKDNTLQLGGQFAFSSPNDIKEKFTLHEGLIGQVAWEQKQIFLTDISEEQIRITSSFVDAKPKNLLITPFLLDGKTVGVIEIGKLTHFTETEKEFIAVSMNSIAISVYTVQQAEEKEKRAAELGIANTELAYQNEEKEKRAAELGVANKELAYQNEEKEKRAAELGIANKELAYQNEEKEKRAAELGIANKELAFQNDEKEKRAAELGIANKELAYQNEEKEKRAAELGIANKELAYQNDEKEKRAVELVIVNKELSNQAEELQIQQEELRQLNEELEQQAQNLKQQQEELQMTNEELEEQTQSLEVKNREVEASKNNIEQKTKQLEISSKYKSEFLANMSHELRTPLNSLLILSKDLSENRKKNLDDVQVESAEIIYKSGHDLLVLINEVLDLSKIEAGKMAVNVENVPLKKFTDNLIRNFKHHAEQKGLNIICKLGKTLPEFIRTDEQRLSQILKNLISNAIKFTEKGSVSILVDRNTENTLIFSVIDSGIGISEDKQTAIFEAFQQAEGGTSRKYGGTGLGLSISRELAKLLEGEITVRSNLDEGATFSLVIPLEINPEQESISTKIVKPFVYKSHPVNDINFLDYPGIKDDRETLVAKDKVVLIIEDDLKFAAILLKQANQKGFKCLTAATGEDGLVLASKYKPQAIILDLGLPGISGHSVLQDLKANPAIRHIPVHVISANDRSLEPIREGAVEYLMKPISKNELEEAFNRIENFVNRKIKNLLIIEDSENSRKAMRILIGNGDVHCFEAATGKEAMEIYEQNHIDCIILDIGLPDISGFDLIQKLEMIKGRHIPPIIVYTGKELSKEENEMLHKYAESIIIKGIKSEERLLDETALFLHRTISNLPKSKQMIINSLHDKEAIFNSKKILLVDDDMRNVFALSKILQERGIEVIKAENGIKALKMLEVHTNIDMVLMDIMMPEMDGYEAMKHIRSQIKYKKLPIIALTAKAMKDDKQKCIDAGANDYITKPIDVERLLSLMRVWLSK